MPRRKVAVKRKVFPDIKYNSVLLSKFINHIMSCGKKSLAERIVYEAFKKLNAKYNVDPCKVFDDAINNIRPRLEVTSVRVGGANYQVPASVSEERSYTLAMRWIKIASEKRLEQSMSERLSEELMDAFNNRGASIKKKEDTHKMADSNRAFAHLRAPRGRK